MFQSRDCQKTDVFKLEFLYQRFQEVFNIEFLKVNGEQGGNGIYIYVYFKLFMRIQDRKLLALNNLKEDEKCKQNRVLLSIIHFKVLRIEKRKITLILTSIIEILHRSMMIIQRFKQQEKKEIMKICFLMRQFNLNSLKKQNQQQLNMTRKKNHQLKQLVDVFHEKNSQ
ncbi:unnamed protein product [Paramecium pentaurelia]|uniref:Uncharacterized protein n=1 Tax=Paramecium pentaurelia TaxID=43138 RepID=A0A8S1WGS6_9CILI|nr:unnamed protein product [Paramecium pentaurelia]